MLVVIPTYDEAENVLAVLERIHRSAPGVHVLVVDDRSPDGTGDRVREYARHRTDTFLETGRAKTGLGTAYRTGFGWALARDYDAIVQMDADLSHPPEQIPALVAALVDHDVAVGSRYVEGGRVDDWKRSRRLVSRAGNRYVRIVLRLPVSDATAGFKAWRRQALIGIGAVESTSNGYCFQIENTWRASRLGLRIAELPITFMDRDAGESKMSGKIALEAVTRVLAWRLGELSGCRPARVSPGSRTASDERMRVR
ncbi:polyprenol monophosphomannose synthase [Nocardioides sp. KIGAM211]|uniref:Polyprenol monophosphomannose synthase n=1 Tax=Nocardioides luti TaxID=2761101 RepID=A0A7X0RKC6_9ACTN|nr:polyprenol monophosphomannose synthase [Nocardioides luti]